MTRNDVSAGDTRTAGRFGTGPLSRISALVYNLIVVELLFLVTTVPGLIGSPCSAATRATPRWPRSACCRSVPP